MIARELAGIVAQSLGRFPVVGLVGARQIGKTTLAQTMPPPEGRERVYLDLELPTDREKLSDAELFLSQRAGDLVVLDEAQVTPELFPILRALVDRDRRPGRFLVLGSASPDLRRQASESLAGRIIYHELHGLALSEAPSRTERIEQLWWRGGYPRSFLAGSDEESFEWRQALVQTHLERDIPGLGYRTGAVALRRFWTMVAHCHGQLWNANKIAGSLGVDYKTVQRCLDILEDTFMVRRLLPHFANVKKRLVKSPKVYLRDSGLLHALLGIPSYHDLLGHPVAGASWEGWVIEQVLAMAPWRWKASFYRTHGGAEIDLVLQGPSNRPLIAVEAKHSLSATPARGFWSAIEDLGDVRGFVVYRGREFRRLRGEVFALPVDELGRIFEG